MLEQMITVYELLQDHQKNDYDTFRTVRNPLVEELDVSPHLRDGSALTREAVATGMRGSTAAVVGSEESSSAIRSLTCFVCFVLAMRSFL